MGCFSSDPPTTPTTTIQTQNLPAYMQTAGAQNVDIATLLGNRPYTPYPNQRISDFSPDTTNSFDLIRQMTGANGGTSSWAPDMTTAKSAVSGMLSTPTSAAAIQPYMDPYASLALQPQIDAINRQAAMTRNQIAGQATNSGAYGGSRHGILEAELNRNTNKLVNDTIGTGLSNAYNSAASLYGADRSQRLSGAQLLAALTGQGQQLGLTDAASLAQIGQQQEGKSQSNLDLAYQDFLNQQAWPEQMLNLRIAALANTPYARNTTTTGQMLVPNTTAQNIGALAALTGGAGMLSNSSLGSSIGSGLSGAWNWLGGLV